MPQKSGREQTMDEVEEFEDEEDARSDAPTAHEAAAQRKVAKADPDWGRSGRNESAPSRPHAQEASPPAKSAHNRGLFGLSEDDFLDAEETEDVYQASSRGAKSVAFQDPVTKSQSNREEARVATGGQSKEDARSYLREQHQQNEVEEIDVEELEDEEDSRRQAQDHQRPGMFHSFRQQHQTGARGASDRSVSPPSSRKARDFYEEAAEEDEEDDDRSGSGRSGGLQSQNDRSYSHPRRTSRRLSPHRRPVSQSPSRLELGSASDARRQYQSLLAEKTDLEHDYNALSRKYEVELADLTEELERLQDKLAEEKAERKRLDEEVSRLTHEGHLKLRESEGEHELQLKEAVRKARVETEEEFKERMRHLEKRFLDEQEMQKDELTLLKRRLDEAQREVESAKRKVALSRSDGILEAQNDLDKLKKQLIELEDKDRIQSYELRKAKDENESLQGRLQTALKAVEETSTQVEALKLRAQATQSEDSLSTAALQQSVQKIHATEEQVAQLKAENLLLRKEKDAQIMQARKTQGAVGSTQERLAASESELRRVRSQTSVSQSIPPFNIS